jgi:hypothetical protein
MSSSGVRDGTASNENAAAMASEVRPLAAAWRWGRAGGREVTVYREIYAYRV